MQPLEWLLAKHLPTYASNRAALRFVYDRIKRAESMIDKRFTRQERRELYLIALNYQEKTRAFYAELRL